MKKVCFLADQHGLYDDRTYWKQAISLLNKGYEVHYVVIGTEDGQGITKEGIFYKLIKRKRYFRNRYINWLSKNLFILKSEYDIAFNYCQEIKAQVYQIEDLWLNKIVHRLKKMKHSPKLVYDIQEPRDNNFKDITFYQSRLPKFLINVFSNYMQRWEYTKTKYYDYIIVVDDGLYRRVSKKQKEVPIQVIYNYTNLLSERKDISLEKKMYDAAYIGGVSSVRGAMVALRAANEVVKSKPDFKLLYLGPIYRDSLKNEMEEYIIRHGLEDNILMHPFVPYSEVSNFYNEVKIGLNPLFDVKAHQEIIQIKLFEYMNFGIPIITSKIGYMEKYVIENNVGIAVEPNDEADLADAILKLLTDKDLCEKFSQNGIRAVNEKYNWGNMEKMFLNIYEQLIGKK